MSISSTVALLAQALLTHVSPTSQDPALLAQLQVLVEMPRYTADARLDLWQEAFLQHGLDRERCAEDPTYRAVIAIYDIAELNLFGEIAPEPTAALLAAALVELNALGVEAPIGELVLTDW